MQAPYKLFRVIGATSFALLMLYVLAVAEDAYGLELDYKLEISICLVVCLLYFVSLIYLFKVKRDIAKVAVSLVAIVGFITLIIFLWFGVIQNPWIRAYLMLAFHR